MHLIRRFWIQILWTAIFALAALIMHFFFLINFYAAMGFGAIGLVAIFINGCVATWEDDQPGGFNNPTHKEEKMNASSEGTKH